MGKAFRTILRDAYKFPMQEEVVIAEVTKEWLRTIDLPPMTSEQKTKELLVCLVDEPV